MSDSPSVAELAASIAENTAKVTAYLRERGLPQPSFAVDGPLQSLLPAEAVDIENARVAVIDATQQLRALMLGPMDYITSFTHDELISMQAIARFKLATSFPVGEEVTFEKVGEACGINATDARRILRHATIKNIFTEPRPGVIAHNAVSRLLAENPTLVDWVGASTDDLWQAASQTVNAMVKYPGSQEPNETGFCLANNTEKSMYLHLSDHPERARRFGSAMTLFTEGAAFDAKHVVDGYPWKDLGKSHVVDVGGSHGAICQSLALAHPDLSFTVQDLDPVVKSAPQLETSIAPRVDFQVYDFFTEQHVKDADVYFFRWIFHNWSDKYAIQILRNLIPALKPGARIVINDNVLPPPGVLPRWREERIRSMDLTMKELQNAREREMDDWQQLFQQADSRFKFQGGSQPPGSMLFILEAIWEP